MTEPKVLLVLSTCPREKAAAIAEALVSGRFAACVNVMDRVESFYWWEGKLNRDAESLLFIKTAPDRLEALRGEIVRIHPYQVPEVVAVPIGEGHAPYLEWVVSMTRSAAG
jgi:periplasmic divalent cation tolerance protein